jgi:SAM-dependent methyltransferase
MGEPVIEIAAPEAYRLWSSSYDDVANPLLSLEMRVLRQRINPAPGSRFIDVATGTGRWAVYAAARGAAVIGFDSSPEMLARAAGKRSLAGRLAVTDMRALPVAAVITELARVARMVVITDLHPMAVSAGWARSFRFGSQIYRIRSYSHSFECIESAARDAGLQKLWETQAAFDAPEKRFFLAAGKEESFARARKTPAIFARCWIKS